MSGRRPIVEWVGIIIFICGLFLGFAVTAFPAIEESDWWLWPAVRVGWLVGGGAWAGVGLGRLLRRRAAGLARWALIGAALGAATCANVWVALARGPVEVRDPIVAAGKDYESLDKRYDEIWIEIETGDETWNLEPIGLQKTRAKRALGECLTPFRGTLRFLPGLDVLLAVDCAR